MVLFIVLIVLTVVYTIFEIVDDNDGSLTVKLMNWCKKGILSLG